MFSTININEALELNYPFIDVRSPSEYNQGHIPNAVNISLFSDEERKDVGIVYKNKSEKVAIELGLKIVNPKLDYFVSQSRLIAPDLKLIIYCWRGGMRSNSFAKLLTDNGFDDIKLINGGYKSYRNFVRNVFVQDLKLKILGGYTGSGKTMILKELKKTNQQVINLEALAHHKGSAFGSIGQDEQPTNEQFENILAYQISNLDTNKDIWLEDESRNIGKVVIPPELFLKMQNSPLYFINTPKEERAKYLVMDYSVSDNQLLKQAVIKITKRLGGQNVNEIIALIDQNRLFEAALITLSYYDKAYCNFMETRNQKNITRINLSDINHKRNAKEILKICNILPE